MKSKLAKRRISHSTTPVKFQLEQNEPNPFQSTTTISFTLARTGQIKLQVLNRDKDLVCLLYNDIAESGQYSIVWNGETDDGQPVPNGNYFYQLLADGFVAIRKLTFNK